MIFDQVFAEVVILICEQCGQTQKQKLKSLNDFRKLISDKNNFYRPVLTNIQKSKIFIQVTGLFDHFHSFTDHVRILIKKTSRYKNS